MVSCSSCGLQDILEFNKNKDEVFLEFLTRFDQNRVSKTNNETLQQEGLVRDEKEINEWIENFNPTEITRSVLQSKQDYVSYFTKFKKVSPEMGCLVEDIGLDDRLVQVLKKKKIKQFYKFQEESIKEIVYGKDVIIEAPTASGKTEAFLIPIIHILNTKNIPSGIFALLIYPTKSLARDQYPKILELAKSAGISIGVFDGDTNSQERADIIERSPQIIITNFDVLHYHLLHQTKFSSLLHQVKFVVVDETHIYSGIFGSNVHYIIKRLKRYSNNLQFVASSATLENASKFCEQLFGTKMKLIKGAGCKGEIEFTILFPSLRNQRALMVDLTKKLTAKKHKTIVFSNSHLNSELLAMQAKKQKIKIKVHRAGLMVNYRRLVEREFKEDKLQAISCTPTLELGIDVGNVDGVISSTIPVNRLVQRIGRAARKGQKGYAFLALGDDPISQYYKNHPLDYFEDKERIYIDPKNPIVENYQVLAMACDKPISKHELKDHRDAIDQHLKDENLVFKQNRYVPNFDNAIPLLKDYSIRGIGKSIDIFLDSRKVGERNLPIALEELHRDAIYFLAGVRYRVKEFYYPKHEFAKLEKIPKDYPYYTKSLTEEWPTIETVYEKRKAKGIEVAFCKLHIQKRVYGYVTIELGHEIAQGKKILLEKPLEYDFITKGITFHAPRPLQEINIAEDEDYVEASGYHATEHVVIEGCNMITGGVSQDLGGISLGTSGLVFVYDSAIGGNGASRALYDRFEKVLQRSHYIVRECPCKNEAGCPRCTFSYRCGNNNEFLHKKSCLEVLERANDGEETILEEPTEGDRPLV